MRNFCSCSINNDRRCANRRRALDISALSPALAWREGQGETITQHDLLGDAAINNSNLITKTQH